MEDWVAKRGLTVIEPRRLKELSRRSDAQGFLQLGGHAAAIIASGTSLSFAWGSWWAVPLFLLHGILLNFLYAGQHELSHWTVFATRRFNDIAGRVTGFLMIYPFIWDRWFHFAHHRNTMVPGKDAELVARGPFTMASYLAYLSGVSYWKARVRRTVLTARGEIAPWADWLSDEQRRAVIAEARWHVAGWAAVAAVSLALQSWAAVLYWLAPMMLTKAAHQLQNLGEHTMLPFHPDTLRNTRTLEVPALLRRLAWNMPYHTAHHTFPGVPFHALPDLHREIEAKLGHRLPSAGYIGAQVEILRRLRRGPEVMEAVPG